MLPGGAGSWIGYAAAYAQEAELAELELRRRWAGLVERLTAAGLTDAEGALRIMAERVQLAQAAGAGITLEQMVDTVVILRAAGVSMAEAFQNLVKAMRPTVEAVAEFLAAFNGADVLEGPQVPAPPARPYDRHRPPAQYAGGNGGPGPAPWRKAQYIARRAGR